MSDDLHDIDRLFREGIEGHEENVPPSVWENVSNDLDKKQASYYKSKYYRLKRAAALLLLLCFLAAVYIVYKEASHGDDKPVVQKNSRPAPTTEPEKNRTLWNSSTSNTNSKNTPSTATPTNGNNSINGAPIPDDDSKQKQTQTLPEDKSSVANASLDNRQTEGNQFDKSVANHERKTVDNTTERLTKEVPITLVTKKHGVSSEKFGWPASTETNLSAKAKKQQSNAGRDNSTDVSSPMSSPYTVSTVAGRNYESPFINLRPVPASNKSFLPKTPAAKSKSKQTAHSFSLSAFAAPNLLFDRLEDNDHLAGPGRDRQTAKRLEQDNVSFSAGLLLAYNVGKNWSLQSGITVTSSSTSIAPTTIYAKPDGTGHARYELHCSSGYAYITPKGNVQPTVNDSTAKTSGTVSKLAYVTVPASVSYRFDAGRFSFYPTVGAGLNILTTGKTKTSLSNTTGSVEATTSISGLKPTYVDGHFGFGMEYNLTKNLSLGLRPNARIALTPINKETPVQSYQNFLSVETGIRIKL